MRIDPLPVRLEQELKYALAYAALVSAACLLYTSFGGKKVVKLLDYAYGLDGLPKSEVLKFLLEDNCSIVCLLYTSRCV